MGQTKIGRIALERKPHFISPVIGHPDVENQAWAEHEQMVSFIGVPLFVGDQLFGVMAMFSRRPLPQELLEAVSTIGRHISLGLERKQTEEQLRHDGLHDTLTGLPNRALFRDRLKHADGRSERRPDDMFAVFTLEIDRFKIVSDSLGQLAGDRLLANVARRLEAGMRSGDTVARVGGDEFAVLVYDVRDELSAAHECDRLHEMLKDPFTAEGHLVHLTASIGGALSSTEHKRPEDLLRNARIAMNRAQSRGHGRHTLFDVRQDARAISLLKLEGELRRAIEREELEVYYQPKMSLSGGNIVGAEALVRWNHPERGMVSPAEFIPLAEETGLIVPLGEWVLRTACARCRVWRESGHPDFRVAVNCSPRQFQSQDLPDIVARVLLETGLEAEALELEITESAAMSDVQSSAASFAALRRLGVGLSIDDFGTGYSSLSYLNQFSIDVLKIDQSFVKGIPKDSRGMALASAVIALGHSLGLKVIAEDVETWEQLEFLRSQQCDEIQGYLLTRPLPVADFTWYLRSWAAVERTSLWPRAMGQQALQH